MSKNEHLGDQDPQNPNDGEFGVDHNPGGSWANLGRKNIQDAILRLAGKHHAACAAENPKLSKFADFLDIFTCAWLAQKAKVEKEAGNYGFTSCQSTDEIPLEDRGKAALLALTLYGSYALLGNGCLSRNGGSAQYERIPFRKDGGDQKEHASSGILVIGNAELEHRVFLQNKGEDPFVDILSKLQALYYTTQHLSSDTKLQLVEDLSESISNFAQTIRGEIEETLEAPLPNRPFKDDDWEQGEVPERPEFQPMI